MAAFTSQNVNKADIDQEKSAAFTFSATLDSKGRVTIPAELRKLLELEEGDWLELVVSSSSVMERKVEGAVEAMNFLRSLQDVKSFSFDGDTVQVVTDG